MRWTWALPLAVALLPTDALAQNVGWLGNTSGNWNTGSNWGVGDVVPTTGAEFATSPNTSISFSGNASINRLRFTNTAPAYTFTIGAGRIFTVAGVGVENQSSATQTFNVAGGTLELSATVQPSTSLANSAVNVSSGALNLRGGSTAATSTITVTSGTAAFWNTATAGSAIVNISGGELKFNDSSTAESSRITATGGVTSFWNTATAGTATINTSGGVVNFQDTSTVGGATVNTSSGYTQISDSASAGTATLNVSGNGVLGFYHDATAANALIGMSSGEVRFRHDTTAGTSTINVTGGDASFGDNATAGNATINFSGGLHTFYDTSTAANATINVSGGDFRFHTDSTAGSSNITVSGGIASFSSRTTAANATIDISGGLLRFHNESTAGASTITATGGTTSFFNTATASNAIINTSGGVVNFQDTSTAASATINTTAGYTQISDSARAGTATLNVSGTGVLAFYHDASAERATIDINGSYRDHGSFNDNASAADAAIRMRNAVFGFYDNATAGRATISLDNSGLYFENTATAANAVVTASRGVIDFYDNSNAGSATISVQNGASLGFYDSSSGGTARVIVGAGSDLDMGWRVSPLTIGSIEGAGTFFLGRQTLITGGNDLSTTVSGRIVNGVPACCGAQGGLTKVGSGTLTLSGDNTYRGTTTVSGGALLVNGSIASSALTSVEAGALIGGSGTVGTTQVNGGTLSPGNSIGTLSVAGSLTLTAASTYLVEISPAASDSVTATGTANPGGATLRAVFAPGAYVSRRYTLLSAAGGVNGTFGALQTIDLPARFTSSLSYDATHAYLDLQFGFTPTAGGFNANQRRVAEALVRGFDAFGGLPDSFASLDARGLSQASGEAATGALQSAVMAQSQFINVLTDPTSGDAAPAAAQPMSYATTSSRSSAEDAFAQLMPKAPGHASAERGWRMFGAAYGGEARIGGSQSVGSHDLTSRVAGMMGGADYVIAPGSRIGFALGGGNTSYGLTDAMGSGRSDMFHAGIFARQVMASAGYLAGALAYGWQDVQTDRTAPGGEQLRAGYKANLIAGRFEAGWRFTTMGAAITPYGAVQAIATMLPSYAETGGGGLASFALAYAGGNLTTTRLETGLRFDRTLALGDAWLTLRARSAWLHHLDDVSTLAASFQALPGIGFMVSGATPAKDAALVSLGSEIAWANGFALAGSFDGEVSANVTSYVGKGSLRYSW